jgi:hypothetical protein
LIAAPLCNIEQDAGKFRFRQAAFERVFTKIPDRDGRVFILLKSVSSKLVGIKFASRLGERRIDCVYAVEMMGPQ